MKDIFIMCEICTLYTECHNMYSHCCFYAIERVKCDVQK